MSDNEKSRYHSFFENAKFIYPKQIKTNSFHTDHFLITSTIMTMLVDVISTSPFSFYFPLVSKLTTALYHLTTTVSSDTCSDLNSGLNKVLRLWQTGAAARAQLHNLQH